MWGVVGGVWAIRVCIRWAPWVRFFRKEELDSVIERIASACVP